MAINKDIVEASWKFGYVDTSDLPHGIGVWKSGYIKYYRAKVRLRSLSKFKRLDNEISIVPLEVLDIHASPIHKQILILKTPT